MAMTASNQRNASLALAALTSLGSALATTPAQACGGFFCGQQPVDQTAERILFEVGQDSVTMTTQISFAGDAADFAWILPLSAVPDPNSLAVYHQQALNALDTNSGPVFNPPQDSGCQVNYSPGVLLGSADDGSDPGVTVYIRTEVGDYDVAVIESTDPALLIDWLHEQGFRITAAMEPYIERYTSEGMKFLALKLQDAATVQDIKPFRFTLPGTAPSIPLRMTALAAEPEMSIVAFVLAGGRYEGKNWANLDIPDDQIRYNRNSYSYGGTNWPRLVAQAVDEAGGQGWVTEYAGPSASYAEQVRAQVQNGNFGTEDDAAAAAELLTALEAHPYLTRLYTRLSAEEMTSDPIFGRSSLGDVSRQHQLSRFVDGIDQCPSDPNVSSDPCDFATCGAGGLCRTVTPQLTPYTVQTRGAGCACVPGATARVTLAPDGSPTVICQDGRMSFLNPGDRDTEASDALPDPCADFECGEHGQCISMNLTPTCVCDQGFVAAIDAAGARSAHCVEPDEPVPASFYQKRLLALPPELPGGRSIEVASVLPPLPSNPVEPAPVGFPMPRGDASGSSMSGDGMSGDGMSGGPTSSGGDGGCSMTSGAPPAGGLLSVLLAAAGLRRRRRSRH
jgi:MYXO-CTERM domain-containing protein